MSIQRSFFDDDLAMMIEEEEAADKEQYLQGLIADKHKYAASWLYTRSEGDIFEVIRGRLRSGGPTVEEIVTIKWTDEGPEVSTRTEIKEE